MLYRVEDTTWCLRESLGFEVLAKYNKQLDDRSRSALGK